MTVALPARSRPRRRTLVLVLAAFVLLGVAYVFWPRTGHLRDFEPARVAQLETRMWRAYYERRYAALLRDLYVLSRAEYGFSPADSLAIAWYAARAAQVFQPTRSRTEAQEALPLLERYYGVLRARGGESFDVTEAARLELDWWQLRREKVPPAVYGQVIAQTAVVVFGTDNADLRRAGLLRAEMMQYRDERSGGRMQEADWAHIGAQLTHSYTALRDGLAKR